MNYDNNPYTRRLDQIEAARKQLIESEWRITFLRSLEAEPPKQPTEQEILKWHIQNQQSAHLN